MGQLLCLRTLQLVLNHENSKNIVFQRVRRFFGTPCMWFGAIILGRWVQGINHRNVGLETH
jgi:hypothetical protein